MNTPLSRIFKRIGWVSLVVNVGAYVCSHFAHFIARSPAVRKPARPLAHILIPVEPLHHALPVHGPKRVITLVPPVVGEDPAPPTVLPAVLVLPLVRSSAVGEGVRSLPVRFPPDHHSYVLVTADVVDHGLAGQLVAEVNPAPPVAVFLRNSGSRSRSRLVGSQKNKLPLILFAPAHLGQDPLPGVQVVLEPPLVHAPPPVKE